jgi:tubulin--tyrosine ligase
MKYICVLPTSISSDEFLKHINPDEYKNLTTIDELKKVDHLEFVYFQLIDSKIKNILYKIPTKYSNTFLLKHPIQFKSELHHIVQKENSEFFDKYFLEQYDLSIDDVSSLKKLAKDTLYIVKPTKSFKGIGNKVFKGPNDIYEYILKNNKNRFHKSRDGKNNKWVVQKYIENPLLLNGKKFHIRWNVLLVNDKVYMYETGAVFPAQLKYDPNDMTMEIHDSHGESSPSEHKCFPNDFFKESYAKDIYKDIYSFLKGMKNMGLFDIECYKEAEKCFGILGIDFMITDKYELKCIEINNRIGFASSFQFTPYLVEGLFDLTLYEKTEGKGFMLVK